MSGDWIKMRSELQSHPKVVRILSATKADKFRVIGGLHAVWAVFDTHSVDGKLAGYTPETMDHIIGWEGFSGAMMAVGWLEYDGVQTLALPEFDEHNGQSAKRRAEDQKRKRNVRKTSDQSSDKLRTESGLDKREDKDKKNSTADAALSDEELFPEVAIEVIRDFRALRKTKKAAISPTAIAGIKREADKAGLSLERVMRICCENGWTGFNASWNWPGKDQGSAPVATKPPKRKEL
jgi:hypothetical protein